MEQAHQKSDPTSPTETHHSFLIQKTKDLMTCSLVSTEDAQFPYPCHINLPVSFFLISQIDCIPLTIS